MSVRFMTTVTRGLILLVVASVSTMAMMMTVMFEKAYASSSVHYVAVFGADNWITQGVGPACDLGLLARIDTKSGTVSLLTLPRDMQYTGYISKEELGFTNESAPLETFNSVFRYQFQKTINKEWNAKNLDGLHAGNYEEAIHDGAKQTCKVMKAITGINVTKYVVVDLYTYMDIIDLVGGVKVDLPAPLKNYRLYSDGTLHTVNDGELGPATLNAHDAMVAARARVPYGDVIYGSLSQYRGNAQQILIKYANGEYGLSGDGTRQFVNRRILASLVDKALNMGNAAWSFAWSQLVGGGLVWTNLSQSDFETIGNGLAKAKKASKFVVFGSQAIDATGGGFQTINGLEQWLYPMKDDEMKRNQLNATVKQFKSGSYMDAGWGSEAIIGLQKGAKKKVKGITYKVLSNSTVSVVKIPNKKKVSIPRRVSVNGKKYNVTTIAKGSMKGSRVRTVILGANVRKIAAKAFAGSKVKTIVLKTTKLKKSTVKRCLTNSDVKIM